jgi:hypothetical protein
LAAARRAAIALALLGVYLEGMEWINLYPWNDIRGGNGQETLDYAVAVILIVLVVWLWRGSRIAALLSFAFCCLWGWLQVTSWWVPYILGATPGWKRTYAKWFANCTQILPSSPDHLPPDANHFVLQLFVLAALVTSGYALIVSSRQAEVRG